MSGMHFLLILMISKNISSIDIYTFNSYLADIHMIDVASPELSANPIILAEDIFITVNDTTRKGTGLPSIFSADNNFTFGSKNRLLSGNDENSGSARTDKQTKSSPMNDMKNTLELIPPTINKKSLEFENHQKEHKSGENSTSFSNKIKKRIFYKLKNFFCNKNNYYSHDWLIIEPTEMLERSDASYDSFQKENTAIDNFREKTTVNISSCPLPANNIRNSKHNKHKSISSVSEMHPKWQKQINPPSILIGGYDQINKKSEYSGKKICLKNDTQLDIQKTKIRKYNELVDKNSCVCDQKPSFFKKICLFKKNTSFKEEDPNTDNIENIHTGNPIIKFRKTCQQFYLKQNTCFNEQRNVEDRYKKAKHEFASPKVPTKRVNRPHIKMSNTSKTHGHGNMRTYHFKSLPIISERCED